MAGTKKVGRRFFVVHDRTGQVLKKRNPPGGFTSRGAAQTKARQVQREITGR